MRFIFLISVFLLYLNPAFPNTDNIYDTSETNALSGNGFAEDTSDFKSDTASVKKSINIILYQLHSLVLEQQYSIKKYKAILAGLVLLVSLLIIIIILGNKKYFYYPRFPYSRQKKGYQSGLVCLQRVSRYFGNRITYRKIKRIAKIPETQNSLSLNEIADIADKVGLQIGVIKTDVRELMSESYLPLILYFPNHMAVLYKITNEFIYIADPYYGFLKLKMYYFLSSWYVNDNNQKGIALLIRPSEYSKGKIKRVNKALSIDFSKIKLLDKKHWKEYKCDILTEVEREYAGE